MQLQMIGMLRLLVCTPVHLFEAREWQLSPEGKVGITMLTARETKSLPVLAILGTDFLDPG